MFLEMQELKCLLINLDQQLNLQWLILKPKNKNGKDYQCMIKLEL